MSKNLVIGNNIKKLREQIGLSQKNIAEYLNVDQSLISKIESGERSLSIDLLEKLSNLFCCPLKKLLADGSLELKVEFAFRTNNLDEKDLFALASVNKIVMNQMTMDEMIKGDFYER